MCLSYLNNSSKKKNFMLNMFVLNDKSKHSLSYRDFIWVFTVYGICKHKLRDHCVRNSMLGQAHVETKQNGGLLQNITARVTAPVTFLLQEKLQGWWNLATLPLSLIPSWDASQKRSRQAAMFQELQKHSVYRPIKGILIYLVWEKKTYLL